MGVNLDGVIATSNSMLANVEALAQSEPSLPSECYDKYSAYATTFHPTLERFRPCDASKCTHIAGLSSQKKDRL